MEQQEPPGIFLMQSRNHYVVNTPTAVAAGFIQPVHGKYYVVIPDLEAGYVSTEEADLSDASRWCAEHLDIDLPQSTLYHQDLANAHLSNTFFNEYHAFFEQMSLLSGMIEETRFAYIKWEDALGAAKDASDVPKLAERVAAAAQRLNLQLTILKHCLRSFSREASRIRVPIDMFWH